MEPDVAITQSHISILLPRFVYNNLPCHSSYYLCTNRMMLVVDTMRFVHKLLLWYIQIVEVLDECRYKF